MGLSTVFDSCHCWADGEAVLALFGGGAAIERRSAALYRPALTSTLHLRHGRTYIVVARLITVMARRVRANCRGTCWHRWPGHATTRRAMTIEERTMTIKERAMTIGMVRQRQCVLFYPLTNQAVGEMRAARQLGSFKNRSKIYG
jgi:hypothetical protein